MNTNGKVMCKEWHDTHNVLKYIKCQTALGKKKKTLWSTMKLQMQVFKEKCPLQWLLLDYNNSPS